MDETIFKRALGYGIIALLVLLIAAAAVSDTVTVDNFRLTLLFLLVSGLLDFINVKYLKIPIFDRINGGPKKNE